MVNGGSLETFIVRDKGSGSGISQSVDIFKVVTTSCLTAGSTYITSMWIQGGYCPYSIFSFNGCSVCQNRKLLKIFVGCCWYSLCTGSQIWLNRTCIIGGMQKGRYWRYVLYVHRKYACLCTVLKPYEVVVIIYPASDTFCAKKGLQREFKF